MNTQISSPSPAKAGAIASIEAAQTAVAQLDNTNPSGTQGAKLLASIKSHLAIALQRLLQTGVN